MWPEAREISRSAEAPPRRTPTRILSVTGPRPGSRVGRPWASTATSTTSASVTRRVGPPCDRRSTSTETFTVMEVRPTRSVSVKKLTTSPRNTGWWNSTSCMAFVT